MSSSWLRALSPRPLTGDSFVCTKASALRAGGATKTHTETFEAAPWQLRGGVLPNAALSAPPPPFPLHPWCPLRHPHPHPHPHTPRGGQLCSPAHPTPSQPPHTPCDNTSVANPARGRAAAAAAGWSRRVCTQPGGGTGATKGTNAAASKLASAITSVSRYGMHIALAMARRPDLIWLLTVRWVAADGLAQSISVQYVSVPGGWGGGGKGGWGVGAAAPARLSANKNWHCHTQTVGVTVGPGRACGHAPECR